MRRKEEERQRNPAADAADSETCTTAENGLRDARNARRKCAAAGTATARRRKSSHDSAAPQGPEWSMHTHRRHDRNHCSSSSARDTHRCSIDARPPPPIKIRHKKQIQPIRSLKPPANQPNPKGFSCGVEDPWLGRCSRTRRWRWPSPTAGATTTTCS